MMADHKITTWKIRDPDNDGTCNGKTETAEIPQKQWQNIHRATITNGYK